MAAAAVQIALTAGFMHRYGWDRDELYFRSAAHHPALGYVDFPPLTAWLGWVVDRLAPDSLVALRMTSLLAGAATVVLVAFLARELGGGPAAQWGAAFCWALTPYILGSASIFHPTWLDALAWVAFLYVATRLVVRDEPRLWPLLGVVAGVGLEAKYTIAFLLVAFAVALLLGAERRRLATRGPWIAAAIALALLLPKLAWQAAHGWPSLDFFSSQNAKTASDTSRPEYVVEQLLFLGAASVVALAGVVWLWRRGLRALALVPVIVALLFLVERGRSYYALPPPRSRSRPAPSPSKAGSGPAAASWRPPRWSGCMQRSSRSRRRSSCRSTPPPTWCARACGGTASSTTRSAGPNWRQRSGMRGAHCRRLSEDAEPCWHRTTARPPPHAVHRESARALEAHDRGSGRRTVAAGLGPVLSGHLSWQGWRPRELRQRFALTVGYERPQLRPLCRRWRPLARIDNRWRLGNEERGRPIGACALRAPLGALWGDAIARNEL